MLPRLFTDGHAASSVHDGKTYEVTSTMFQKMSKRKNGLLVADSNWRLVHNPLLRDQKGSLPELHRWSDIAYL
jgi:hypothetical protein